VSADGARQADPARARRTGSLAEATARYKASAAAASAPDYAEALIGWRIWCVVETALGLRLASVIQDDLWPVGAELVARCRAHESPSSLFSEGKGAHPVPALDCTCGIHAAREPAAVWTYLQGRDEPGTIARILGRVMLWGQVVEHKGGWRAERARPLDFVTGAPELRARLSRLLDGPRVDLRHAPPSCGP
jgi:hypothetical protein